MVTWAGLSKKSPVIVMSVPPPRLPASGNTDNISAREKKNSKLPNIDQNVTQIIV